MFWNKFINLCNKKGVSPTAVVTALNISVSNVTSWKKGAIPNDTTISKITNYFNVPFDYFSDADSVYDEEASDFLEQLRNNPKMRTLFSLAKNYSLEEINEAFEIVKVLKEHRHG